MNAKERYNLRQKLQAALTRLVDILGPMLTERVEGTAENMATVEAAWQMLGLFCDQAHNAAKADDQGKVAEQAAKALVETRKRRAMATHKRRARSLKQKLRSRRPPSPPTPTTGST